MNFKEFIKQHSYVEKGAVNEKVWRVIEQWECLNDWICEIDGAFTDVEVSFFVELFNKTVRALVSQSTSRGLYALIVSRCYYFVNHSPYGNEVMANCRIMVENAVAYIIEYDLKKMPKYIVVDGYRKTEIHLPIRVPDVYNYAQCTMSRIL